MDTFARNALRVSLAGAGIVVIGASYVGQASADESPSAPRDAGPAATGPSGSPLAVPTPPAPQYLRSPASLDTFALPTVSDIAGQG